MLLSVGVGNGARTGASPIRRSVRLSPRRTLVCLNRSSAYLHWALIFWLSALNLSVTVTGLASAGLSVVVVGAVDLVG